MKFLASTAVAVALLAEHGLAACSSSTLSPGDFARQPRSQPCDRIRGHWECERSGAVAVLNQRAKTVRVVTASSGGSVAFLCAGGVAFSVQCGPNQDDDIPLPSKCRNIRAVNDYSSDSLSIPGGRGDGRP
ncbi:hypothetical protein E4U53_005114 [Claviceps sorghi]|nr:hypothetical protein E4U53_005114 [Claviceps sorghi]